MSLCRRCSEQLVKLPKTESDDRIQQRTAEHIAVIPVPHVVEKLVVVSSVFPHDRSQQRFAEQTGETLDISLAEKIVEEPITQTQGKTQQVVNTHVLHVVNTVDAEVPLSQFTDKAVDIPVVAQRQISTVQTVQKSKEISQLQYCEEVIDVPVVLGVQASQSQAVGETAEIPQLQVNDQVVDVSVVVVAQVPQVHVETKTVEITQLQPVEQVPHVHVVKKTVEDPQFQIVEKTAEAPQTQTIQVTQTSESLGIECDEGHELMLQGNDSVSVAKDVEDEANEVSEKSPDCMVRSSASGSMRQPRRSQEQQTVQGEKG